MVYLLHLSLYHYILTRVLNKLINMIQQDNMGNYMTVFTVSIYKGLINSGRPKFNTNNSFIRQIQILLPSFITIYSQHSGKPACWVDH